jgi:very-short-patch-repair endonuclease
MANGLRMTQAEFDRLRARRDSNRSDRLPVSHNRPSKQASYLEEMLAAHMQWFQVAGFEREYAFDAARKWRIDFAWPAQRLAVEVQGAVHRTRERFAADFEKIQALTLSGWRYLPLSSEDIRAGRAVSLICAALAQ